MIGMVARDVDVAFLRVVDKELWEGVGDLRIHKEILLSSE